MMAARKKAAKRQHGGSGGADVRAFTVVVEEINAKMNVFGEGLQALRETMVRELAAVRTEMRDGLGPVPGHR